MKLDEGYLLDVAVQANPDGTGYITFTMADSKNQENVTTESVPMGTPNSGQPLAKEIDKNSNLLTTAITSLLKRVSGAGALAPVSPTAKPSSPVGGKLLTIEVMGNGDVSSQPVGIACPVIPGRSGECKHTFAADPNGYASVVVKATPKLPASVVHWRGAACTNSQLDDPYHCQLSLSKNEQLQIYFERSFGRKFASGLLLGLGAAGVIAGGVLLGFNRHTCDAGGPPCYLEMRDVGGSVLGGSLGLALAGTLVYVLPL